MARDWKEVKAALEEKTKEIFLRCPDEIKKFHYGIMTHSDAGKYSLDQYFGHMVHAYSGYYSYVNEIGVIIRLAMDPDLEIKHIKKVFDGIIMSTAPFMGEYAGQHTLANYSTMVGEAFDSCTNKQDLTQLLTSYLTFMSRLYWWFHWYFPWGVGPAVCHRNSPEEIREMARLAGVLETSPD